MDWPWSMPVSRISWSNICVFRNCVRVVPDSFSTTKPEGRVADVAVVPFSPGLSEQRPLASLGDLLDGSHRRAKTIGGVALVVGIVLDAGSVVEQLLDRDLLPGLGTGWK